MEFYELATNKTEVKCKIEAMSTFEAVVNTHSKTGPLKFEFTHFAKSEGDIQCLISLSPNFNEDNLLYCIRDKLEFKILPKQATQKRTWLANCVYIQLSSQTGCQIGMRAHFTDEEKVKEKKLFKFEEPLKVRDLVARRVSQLRSI